MLALDICLCAEAILHPSSVYFALGGIITTTCYNLPDGQKKKRDLNGKCVEIAEGSRGFMHYAICLIN